MAARSSAAAGLLESWFEAPSGLLLSVVTVVCVIGLRSLRRADHSSSGVLLTVVCLTDCDLEILTMRRSWPTRARTMKTKILKK